MKVNFKRVATAALAVAMSLSLNVSAFAAEPTDVPNGSLTVTGDQLAGKYVYAIQMFEAHALDHGAEEDPQYTYDSYTLNEKWLPFFRDVNNISKEEWVAAGVIAKDTDTIEDYSDAAVEYLQYLAENGHEMQVPAFAEKAQDWAEKQKVFTRNLDEETGKVTSVSIAAGWKAEYALANKLEGDETKGSATFDSLAAGYYLVYPEGGSTGINEPGVTPEKARGTDAMLLNIPNEKPQSWNIKSTFPTVDKTVDTDNDGNGEAADNGSAQVGDTVTFTLTSKVPDMTDYQTFYFAFNDTMSKGLEFVQKQPETAEVNANDVTVTIGGATVATTYYTASLTNNKLKVEFKNLKTVSGATTGATITVTYQAKITKEAVSAGDSILGTAENEANVEYSNDPNGTGHGTSTPDKSKVYTYDIKIEKYWVNAMSGDQNVGVGVDGSWDGNHDMELESLSLDTNEKYLAGATFVLSNSQETPTKTGEPAAYGPEVVRLTGNVDTGLTVDPVGAVTEFTTKDAAVIIKGLEAGTYYLHEIDAPDGFNKLKEPVEIQIVVEPILGNDATNNATLDNPVYIIDGEVNTVEDNAVKVENKQGIELPETGSIGTIGLAALGVVVVVAGLFAFPRKKKTRQD